MAEHCDKPSVLQLSKADARQVAEQILLWVPKGKDREKTREVAQALKLGHDVLVHWG